MSKGPTDAAAGGSLEAKIVVLGSQGVGKTSLVHRYVKNAFVPPTTISTIGASFLTKRVVDIDSGTVVRLQIWDTAGQERFRSISKLYYRGANAALLCYDITDPQSFEEMGRWMRELKANLGDDIVVHVVGTKSDVAGEDPSQRRVPFERCIKYVAENLYPSSAQATPSLPPWSKEMGGASLGDKNSLLAGGGGGGGMLSPQSNRSSGFWGGDVGWDCCHEISAKDGEGVEEVFRVITRRLVEQRARRREADERRLSTAGTTPGAGQRYSARDDGSGYFDYECAGAGGGTPGGEVRGGGGGGANGNGGSFRLGLGDKRRSWLGLPTPGGGGGGGAVGDEWRSEAEGGKGRKGGRCC